MSVSVAHNRVWVQFCATQTVDAVSTLDDLIPQPLEGGRSTSGVVRIGGMVHRPTSEWSPFIHAVLIHIEAVGLAGAPRFRGVDEAGREMVTFLDGEVPHDIEQGSWTDEQLRQAAALLRRLHDVTAGSALAGSEEVVCHNDFAPWNTVFVEGTPAAVIDFDDARPGPRMRDLSYALWCWLALGAGRHGVAEQARRIALMCAAYGLEDLNDAVPAIALRQQEILARHTRLGWIEAAGRVAGEIEWMDANRIELARLLAAPRPSFRPPRPSFRPKGGISPRKADGEIPRGGAE